MPLRALLRNFCIRKPTPKSLDMALAQVYQIKAEIAQAFYQLGVTYCAIGNAPKTDEALRQADRLLNEVEAVQKIEQALRHL